MLAVEMKQMPETLLESEWLDTLIEMSPACAQARKSWPSRNIARNGLPPALRAKGIQ